LGLCEFREKDSIAVPLGTPFFVLRPFGKYVEGFSVGGDDLSKKGELPSTPEDLAGMKDDLLFQEGAAVTDYVAGKSRAGQIIVSKFLRKAGCGPWR